jgi:hypothetical protein
MKRIWLGLGLLVLLLVLGLTITRQMDQVHSDIADGLEKAARSENWTQAISQGQQARAQWEEHRRFTASFSEHKNIDQIDSLFAQLEVYENRADALSHAATCAYLSKAISALLDTHRLTWWNLL